MPQRNVFPSFGSGDETAAYRKAVASIIVSIQRDFDLTDGRLGDEIEVSGRTILNARNMETDLSSLFLTRLGQRFGGHYLNPYYALSGGHYAPNDANVDPAMLTDLGHLLTWLGKATHPDGPGGREVVHCEILDGAQIAEVVRRHVTGIVERARKVRG